MSCPLGVGQARAQDSYQQRVPKTYTKGLQMRPFFISIRGHSHNLNPGTMSRQIYYEANISCSCGHRSPGIAVSAGVVPIRTVWPLNLVGIALNTVSIYVIPAVLSFLLLRMRATETNSSICKVASLDCFGPASAF